MATFDQGADRRTRLAAARLYLVLDSDPPGHALPELLRRAAAGGVDVVQLRDKRLPDEELVSVARAAKALCEQLELLFVVNDRPFVALQAGADGIHVGQEDMAPAEVREIVGEDLLVGLSTHAPAEIDAARAPLIDYIGVGPIHETPTKPGRPAVGLELVHHAAAHSTVPFFAIGGLNAGNLGDVLAAGATRVCVLRAITGAEDPEAAAHELTALMTGAATKARP